MHGTLSGGQAYHRKFKRWSKTMTARVQHPEPMIPFPDLPWQKVGTDLFAWNGHTYLLVVDYYSRFKEIVKLSNTSSTLVINHLQSIFAQHGIPNTVVSENGHHGNFQILQEGMDLP